MTIREADRHDCARLDTLLTKLINYESKFDTNLNPDYVVTDNYRERLDLPGHKAFVAEEDGEIVGYIYGYILAPNMYHKPISVADAMYVEEAYRNRGIATNLLKEFIKFSVVQGVLRVELKVMSKNTGAMRIYESLGFEETKKYMMLGVD